MEVVAFVGPSGTGKSHHAIGVAFDNRCDAIIDDGLLIKGTKILAGTSAKNEDNRIQAVKRAIFTDEGHAQAVREALATNNIHRLLIIATSDNMINKIIGRLKLDKPVKTVYINQIASKAEIKKARHARLQEGKHIVPVPTIELKPHFTGYFADLPYNIFPASASRKGCGPFYRTSFVQLLRQTADFRQCAGGYHQNYRAQAGGRGAHHLD